MRTRTVVLGILLILPCLAIADWPGFRGPKGTGISDEKGLPVTWSEKNNIAWKTRLPGPGASSPAIWGDRVFVTCWTGYAESRDNRGDLKKLRRHLVCLDRKSGKILWKSDVPAKLPEVEWGRALSQHGYTTSTPVTDGKRVYVFFGKTGVFAYDFKGNRLWHTEVGKYLNNFGSGSSPALWKNLLIVNAAVEGGGLIALDKTTGKKVWRVKLYDDCWTTPLVVNSPRKKQELILMTPTLLRSFDPATGKDLWQCDCPEPGYVSANPVARDGVVYVMGSGTLGRVFMAVRLGGKGDVTKSHVVWKKRVGASFTSPILVGPNLYFFSELAHCLKAKTGDIVFRERLDGLGREYGSPVAADGKIYLFTREGSCYVLAAKNKLEILARNTLGDADGFTASPAIDGGQIFVRSNTYLYCIGKKGNGR